MANERTPAPDSQGSSKSTAQSSNQASRGPAGQNANQGQHKPSSNTPDAQKGKERTPPTPLSDRDSEPSKQGAQVPGRTPAEINPDSNKAYGPGGGKVQNSPNNAGNSSSRPGIAKGESEIDSGSSNIDDVPSDTKPR